MISTGGKGTGRAGSDNGDQIWEGVEMLGGGVRDLGCAPVPRPGGVESCSEGNIMEFM